MGDECASSPVMGAGESCVSRSGRWVSLSVPIGWCRGTETDGLIKCLYLQGAIYTYRHETRVSSETKNYKQSVYFEAFKQ